MRKLFIAALLALTATVCFGQSPQAALYTPPTSDVYVGYITTFPDYGPEWNSFRFNGFEASYTRNVRPHWAVSASVNGLYGSAYHVKQYSALLGPRYNILTGNFRPFIYGQVGYSHQSSNGMYANDHHPPLAPGTTDNESGLSYRVGGGGDVQLGTHVFWRIIQWDFQPQPWGRDTPWYENFSSGIGFRF